MTAQHALEDDVIVIGSKVSCLHFDDLGQYVNVRTFHLANR